MKVTKEELRNYVYEAMKEVLNETVRKDAPANRVKPLGEEETPEVDLAEEVDEGIMSGLKSAGTALGRATGWIGQKWSPHEWGRLTPEDFAEALRTAIGSIAAVSNAAHEVGPEKSGLSAEWQSKFEQAAISLADVIHNVPRSSPAAEEEAAEEIEEAATEEVETEDLKEWYNGSIYGKLLKEYTKR